MSLADQAQGRIISSHIDVKLTPQQGGELGDTEAASDAGHLLIDGALRLLKQAAEKNGFKVEIDINQVVF